MPEPDPIEGVKRGGRLGWLCGPLALFLALSLAWAVATSGCWRPQKLDPTPVAVAETVRIGVVDDAAMAEAIGRLKAEWHAVTGNTLEVVEAESLDSVALGEGEGLWARCPADSGHGLGTLVEADRLVPVPQEVRESSQAAWPDLFLLVQQGTVWGEDVWAVPLGRRRLTLLYRRDLFEKFNRTPPTTWAEYQALVQFFAKRENLGDSAPPADAAWHGTLEPLAGGWGAKLLLSRAAAYAKHRDNFSTLFNIETFEPLVAGPPFVRALEELVAANRRRAARRSPLGRVRRAGRLFLPASRRWPLTWPTAAGRGEVDVKVGFAELPGGSQMFNFASGRWDERTADESVHVPLVPLEGRLGVVIKGSEHASAAFGLLTWLAGEKWGTRVSSVSAATTLYRRSQQKEVSEWVEPDLERSAAREYARVVTEAVVALGVGRRAADSRLAGVLRGAGRSGRAGRARRSQSSRARCKPPPSVSNRSASGWASSGSGQRIGGIWGSSREGASKRSRAAIYPLAGCLAGAPSSA